MTKLSVNINKIALLRNARGGNLPDVLKAAVDCERFGTEGITVHPRPDGRHIRQKDVFDLKATIKTEFNIEGYPTEEFLRMVCLVRPTQVTLVPDPPTNLTSDKGWDVDANASMLKDVLNILRKSEIRSSVFVDPNPKDIVAAAELGADRVELYTGPYAHYYTGDREKAIAPYIRAAQIAIGAGLSINAGHDLNLENLGYFCQNIPFLSEVSIGHALISDAMYFGLQNTIQMYLRLCNP